MTFGFGARTLGFMQGVDPRLVDIAKTAILRSPVDFGCTEKQTRTIEEQAAKVRAGVSRSYHGPHVIGPTGYGRALDLVPWIDGKFTWGGKDWRVKAADGEVLDPFFDIAALMRQVAIEKGVKLRWGGCWDRVLNDLPPEPEDLRKEVYAYAQRHVGSDLLDLPHHEIMNP